MMEAAEKIEEPALHRQLTYPLARLNARLTAQATRLLKKNTQLTLSQWRLMVFLDTRGPRSVADFIRFSGFDKGQMSRVAHDLIGRGFLTSEPSKRDHRVQILSLTETGRAAYLEAQPHMHARRHFLLNSLSDTEKAQFFALLEKIEQATDAFEAEI